MVAISVDSVVILGLPEYLLISGCLINIRLNIRNVDKYQTVFNQLINSLVLVSNMCYLHPFFLGEYSYFH